MPDLHTQGGLKWAASVDSSPAVDGTSEGPGNFLSSDQAMAGGPVSERGGKMSADAKRMMLKSILVDGCEPCPPPSRLLRLP